MNKTLFLSQAPDNDGLDQPQGEARMREALGLRTDGSRAPTSNHRPDRILDHGSNNPRRHRFVQEGEVPVEIMTLREHAVRAPAGPGTIARHRVDDNAVAAEKIAREQAERAFHEISERYRELQTKLGHAELARDEALALASRRQSQIDILLAQPPAPPPPPIILEAAPVVTATIAAPRKIKSATKKTVVAPRVKEPQPVKWWIKSNPASKG
jgi:hypothetical protein